MSDSQLNKVEYSSLQRGLQILKLVQNHGRVSASDISRILGMPLSTVYRYVNILKASGFAIDVEGTLVPSERLAEGWANSSNLVRLASPILQQLRLDTNMTSMLAVRVHTAALCLDVCYAHPKHRVAFRRAQMRSLHAGATALSLLAYAPQNIVDEVLGRRYREYTAATLSSGELAVALKHVRQDGYAVSQGQTTPGMRGVGVPVFVNNSCIASISLVGEDRDGAPSTEALVGMLQARAQQLSSMISVDEYGDAFGSFPD